jgi:hypothetical protein
MEVNVSLEDIITQLANLLPYPYNIILSIIIIILIYLVKFYYTNNKVKIDKLIKLNFKKIIIILILLVILVFVKNFLFPGPEIKITSPSTGAQVDVRTDVEVKTKNIPHDKFMDYSLSS